MPPTEESPKKPVETQSELYTEPRGAQQIEWMKLPSGTQEIGPEQRGMATSGTAALRQILTPAHFGRMDAEKRREIQRDISRTVAAIEHRLVKYADFNPALMHTGDRIALRDGAIYFDLKSGKRYAFKLDKGATLEVGYEEMKPKVVEKSRSAWKSLEQAFQKGILTDVMAALAGGDWRASSLQNRERFWTEVMSKGEKYRGTTEQNREMLKFLKEKVDKGEEIPIVAPGEQRESDVEDRLYRFLELHNISQTGEAIQVLWQKSGRDYKDFTGSAGDYAAIDQYVRGLPEADRARLARELPSHRESEAARELYRYFGDRGVLANGELIEFVWNRVMKKKGQFSPENDQHASAMLRYLETRDPDLSKLRRALDLPAPQTAEPQPVVQSQEAPKRESMAINPPPPALKPQVRRAEEPPARREPPRPTEPQPSPVEQKEEVDPIAQLRSSLGIPQDVTLERSPGALETYIIEHPGGRYAATHTRYGGYSIMDFKTREVITEWLDARSLGPAEIPTGKVWTAIQAYERLGRRLQRSGEIK